MADTITISVDALFCRPFVHRRFVRMFEGGKDVTPPVDHLRNRRNCAMANRQNAELAARFGVVPPYYHYDAIGERVIFTPWRPPPSP